MQATPQPTATALLANSASSGPIASAKSKVIDHSSVHAPLSDAVDLVAELQLGTDEPSATAAAAAVEQVTPSSSSSTVVPSSKQLQAAQVHEKQLEQAAVQLTPEQEAAVVQCTNDFVEQYEHAFLSRAVQHLADFCQQQGLPESVVASKLRTRGIDLSQLQERAAEVQRGIAECESDEGWNLIQDGQLRLMYRHSPGSTVHCFKGSCVLPAPMEQPLSMAREFDLVKTWNNYITNSSILKAFCDIDVLVYASVWMPWPLAERDVLISAVADDQLKEHGSIAVSFASPKEAPSDADLPAGSAERVHLYFTEGSCMTITPMAAPEAVTVQGSSVTDVSSGQQTKIVIVSNIDSKLAHVPEGIISFVLKVFAPFMYKTVLNVLHKSFDDPSEPLPQRMAQHHELYDQMKERCQAYLDGHPM